MVRIELPDRTIARSFDVLGRVTEIRDNTSAHAWRYDEAGRIIQVDTTTATGNHRLEYQYDTLDRVTQRTLSGTGIAQPEPTTYSWDLDNRLTGQVSRFGPEGNVTEHRTAYTYDAASRLHSRSSQIVVGTTSEPSLTQRYHYDQVERLSRIEYVQNAGLPSEQLIERIDYNFDARGQIVQKTTLNNNGTGAAETPMEATYDAANRMQTITLKPGEDVATHKTYQLGYDANGNLISKVNAANISERTTYSWDSQNRLTGLSQTEASQSISASYQYDLYGRRISSTVQQGSNPPQTVQYVYDGATLLGELRGGQLTHRLVGGLNLDENIARLAMTPAGIVDLARSRQMLTDAIHSTLAQTNAQGSGIANSYGYSPYGQSSTIGPDATNNPSQYTGRENDADTGLMFYRARYYDPVLKRFISEDPIGLAGGMNVYAYVNGNPVSLNDPTGLVSRNGNNFSDIPPPGPGCQKAVFGPGGYIYGWKPCDQPPDTPTMQCKADPKPWNPPENPTPTPTPPAPPTPAPSLPQVQPTPQAPPSNCKILPFGFCIEATGQLRYPRLPFGCIHKAGEAGNYAGCGFVSNTGFSVGANKNVAGNTGSGPACLLSLTGPFGSGADIYYGNGGASAEVGAGFGNAGPSLTCGVKN